MDALGAWQVRDHLANDALKGHSDSYTVLDAKGMLPHGTAGSAEFEAIRQGQQPWLQQLRNFGNLAVDSVSINLNLQDKYVLYGAIENYYHSKGLMHYRASNLNGQSLLSLWIDHLCLCADSQLPDSDRSYLIASDQTTGFTRLESTEAIRILLGYCQLFEKGQSEILPIFPKSSYAFALETDVDKAMKKALAAWQTNRFNPVKADEEDEYIQLALRNYAQIPLHHPEFADYASMLYGQALNNMITL